MTPCRDAVGRVCSAKGRGQIIPADSSSDGPRGLHDVRFRQQSAARLIWQSGARRIHCIPAKAPQTGNRRKAELSLRRSLCESALARRSSELKAYRRFYDANDPLQRAFFGLENEYGCAEKTMG